MKASSVLPFCFPFNSRYVSRVSVMCRYFDSHRMQCEYVRVCVNGWTNDLFFHLQRQRFYFPSAFNFRLSNWSLLLSLTVPHSQRVYVPLFQCAQSEIARTGFFSIFHFWHRFNFNWPHRSGFELNVEYARRKWTAATDLNLSSDDKLEIKCWYFHTFFSFFRKYLIENIRVSLFCPDQSQLLYTQSCYEFRMESNRLTPSHIDDTCGESTHNDHISFEDDWISRKVYRGMVWIETTNFDLIQFYFRMLYCIQIRLQ